jgi:hypothetical protein
MTQLFHKPEVIKVLKLQQELDKIQRIFCDEFFSQYCSGVLSLKEYQDNCEWIKSYIRHEVATVERLYLFGRRQQAEHEILGMENRFGFTI